MPFTCGKEGLYALRRAVLVGYLLLLGVAQVFAQNEPSPLRTFGYFQNSFQYAAYPQSDRVYTTFVAQQLNLFFQKDLQKSWTALVNFEVINGFSSSRRWGAFNLEEAWVRYRGGRYISVKLGLHTPIFNNLNEIKNRTPLLPYIIRPFVYEASLGETVGVEEFLPNRAYVQAYGYLPAGALKIDYAAYLGNSPNVNDRRERGQTGVDTTDTFLVGGRLGIRYGELKAGVSGTYDYVNLHGMLQEHIGGALPDFQELPRTRLGADLSYHRHRLHFESEMIQVAYTEEPLALDLDLFFFYATLGYNVTDRLLVYGSYWLEREHIEAGGTTRFFVDIPTAGISYTVNDMITLKGQYAYADIDGRGPLLTQPESLSLFAAAVSVIF